MLATKAADRDYLRNRRTYLLNALQSDYRSLKYLKSYLKGKEISETEDTIKDDIRKRLKHVNHKYLLLIDLGFDSKSNRDYEIQTAELLTSELDFKGARLGDTRKPDVCVYYGKNGLIIDNKAYANGYTLPMSQADEMARYIEENKIRQIAVNPNKWWRIFDDSVEKFNYAFVSGEFTGGFRDRLKNIYERTGVAGAAVSTASLLLLAEELKSGRLAYPMCFSYFDKNEEIRLSPYEDKDYNFESLKIAEESHYGEE
ncbi:MAG: hypothetical protein NC400_14560 [Clostridium sp.]|nr:hypothetical protein [Clostridium sp.]